MRDVIEEGGRMGPASLLALVAAGTISIAIGYNALFGQERRLADFPEGATIGMVVDRTAMEPTTVRLRYDPLVEEVQRELLAAGLYAGAVDGVAGKRTRQAIETYQNATSMAITGEPSPGLAEHIRFTREVAEASLFTGSAGTDEAEARARIRRVQTGLAELAYVPGEITGELTGQTAQAIRQFEHDRGMAQTGEVSEELLAELAKMSGQSEIAAEH